MSDMDLPIDWGSYEEIPWDTSTFPSDWQGTPIEYPSGAMNYGPDDLENPNWENQLYSQQGQIPGTGTNLGGLPTSGLGALASLFSGGNGAGLLQALAGLGGLGLGAFGMTKGANTPGPSNNSGVYQQQANNSSLQQREMTPWFNPLMAQLMQGINTAQNQTPMAQGNTQASAATQALSRGEMPNIDPRMVDMLSAAYSRAAGDIAENSVEDARRRGFAGGLDLLGGAASPMYARQMSTLQEGIQQAIPELALKLPQYAANLQHVNTATNLMPTQSLLGALGPASQLANISNSNVANNAGSQYNQAQGATPSTVSNIGSGLNLGSAIAGLGTPYTPTHG